MVNGAGRLNFVVKQGRKWAPLLSSWTNEAGTAVVPSSYSSATMTIYDTDGTTLETLSTAGGEITLGATTIEFLLTSTQTAALAVGTYDYDMSVTGADTYPFAFLSGVVTVEVP